MGILISMKLRLLDYLDVLHSEFSPKIKLVEAKIAKIINTKGLSTYFAHNIAFYPDSGDIVVGVYDCGLKYDVHYIKKVDSITISTKPKVKTLVESTKTYTRLDSDLKSLIINWADLTQQ